MATKVNEILQFASQDTGSNLLTQTEYDGDAQRIIGHQPGIARSRLENKVLRQASLMAAGLAQFIVDNNDSSVTDGMSAQEVADALSTTVGGIVVPGVTITANNMTVTAETLTAFSSVNAYVRFAVNIGAPNAYITIAHIEWDGTLAIAARAGQNLAPAISIVPDGGIPSSGKVVCLASGAVSGTISNNLTINGTATNRTSSAVNVVSFMKVTGSLDSGISFRTRFVYIATNV